MHEKRSLVNCCTNIICFDRYFVEQREITHDAQGD